MMATSAAPSDPIEKKLDMSLDQIVQERQTQQVKPEKASPTTDGRARSTKRAERLAQKEDDDTDDEGSADRRVYVGNLPWSVKWQELKDHMRAAGEVERAVVLESNGRSKGCGIVTYATEEEAQRAIEMLNDSELEGRKIFVREDREDKPIHTGTRVFVGNLSYRVKWQDLKDHMKQAGNVVHADVLMEGPGRSRGCGMVEYATEDEAKLAIATLHDTELEGRKIFVREDREPEGGSISSIANRAGGGRKGASPKKGSPSGKQRAPRTPPSPPSPASPESPAFVNDGTSLYVGNIPWDTTWEVLKDVFRQVGDVESAEVAQYSSGRSRGFGIVRFVNPRDALQAIERLNGTELNGRTIEVRYDKGK